MANNSYITFNDALKSGVPSAFSSMIKPVGSSCNLNCTYCYYLDKALSIYENYHPVMSFEILEEYIRQYIEGNEGNEVTFVWHGGEPLMAGLQFYRKSIEF